MIASHRRDYINTPTICATTFTETPSHLRSKRFTERSWYNLRDCKPIFVVCGSSGSIFILWSLSRLGFAPMMVRSDSFWLHNGRTGCRDKVVFTAVNETSALWDRCSSSYSCVFLAIITAWSNSTCLCGTSLYIKTPRCLMGSSKSLDLTESHTFYFTCSIWHHKFQLSKFSQGRVSKSNTWFLFQMHCR